MLDMVAQKGLDWTNLGYLLILVVLPALSTLGKKLRERFADSHNGEPDPSGEDESDSDRAIPPPARPIQAAETHPRNQAPPPFRPKHGREAPARAARRIPPPPVRAEPVISTSMIERARAAARRQDAPRARLPEGKRARRRSKIEQPPAPKKRVTRAEKNLLPDESPTPQRAHRSKLRSLSASDMRSAVILSELLAPPLALRKQQSLIPGLD